MESNLKKPRTQRLPRNARRAQILRVATELFSKKGLSGTRTRELAWACGINESVIYRHFESKEQLFEAALEAKIREYDIPDFLSGLDADLTTLEVFQTIALRILSIGIEDPLIHKLLLAATFEGNEETHRLFMTWRVPFVEHLEGIIRDGIEHGEMRSVDPLLTARAFVGLVMDCVLNCNLWGELGYENVRPDELVQNNVPIFVRGLMLQT